MELTVGVLGAGNMGLAIIQGMIASGYNPKHIFASTRSEKNNSKLQDLAVQTCASNKQLVEVSDVILLATKPQQVLGVLDEIKSVVHIKQPLIVSVIAGMTGDVIKKHLGESLSWALAMPNTPGLIGKGMTGLYNANSLSAEQCAFVKSLFAGIGQVEILPDESSLLKITAVSGSGPAYYFLIFEKLIQHLGLSPREFIVNCIDDIQSNRESLILSFMMAHKSAAVDLGLSEGLSSRAVNQTALGACHLALEEGCNLAMLRQQVTSKGGTTAAGLAVLDCDELEYLILEYRRNKHLNQEDLDALFVRVVNAASKRAAELAALLQ